MSLKVIVADADSHFAFQAQSFLESHAHLVAQHSTEQAVLAAARKWRPDLVIVSAEIATDRFWNGLNCVIPRPAVLLTANLDQPDVAHKAWKRGGDELLMKPIFHAAELHEAIISARQNAMAKTQTRRQAIPA